MEHHSVHCADTVHVGSVNSHDKCLAPGAGAASAGVRCDNREQRVDIVGATGLLAKLRVVDDGLESGLLVVVSYEILARCQPNLLVIVL